MFYIAQTIATGKEPPEYPNIDDISGWIVLTLVLQRILEHFGFACSGGADKVAP